MLKTTVAALVLLIGAGSASAQTMDHSRMDHSAHMATMTTGQRQADVAKRGKDVMPFSLAATAHIFTKTARGGVQRVVVKKSDDTDQVKLTRLHLQEIREQFLNGDYSSPTRIHGQDMPGLADLKAATPGQVAITYTAVKGGAELRYATANAALVTALHRWFDAQLSDHGKDAMVGHTGRTDHSGHMGHSDMKKP